MGWRGSKQQDAGWTERDSALVHTLLIARCLAEDRLHERPFIASRFTLPHIDERILAAGPYDLHWWGAVGDGSWSTGGSMFVAGTGKLGAGLMIGSLIGNSRAKSKARATAAADATMRWRPVDAGNLHVSTHAFYLSDGEYGHRQFDLDVVHQIDVPTPGVAQISFQTDDGSTSYWLASPWAELVFAVWVIRRRHPHPQWLDSTWFPFATMRERCAYYGYDMPQLTR